MAVSADFSASSRVSTAPFSVIFTDTSTGPGITSRSWDFGDGVTYDTTSSVFSYAYESAGLYTVSLTVTDGTDSDTKTKTNYIAVNPDTAAPSMIIAKSDSKGEKKYWNFYIDQEGHLIFENEQVTHRSIDKIIDIDKWTFVQYNLGENKMYAGDPNNFVREIKIITTPTSSPESPANKRLYSAFNSSLIIDELKIWYGDQDLTTKHIRL